MKTDEMDDATLMRHFDRATIPTESWHHREHVRVAWNMLSRCKSFDAALDALRAGIIKLNAANQVPDAPERGYHETLTHAYLRLIDSTRRHYGAEATSLEFVGKHPQLQRYALRLFYTRERIMQPEAKMSFVEPDLAPLPR